MTEKTSSQAAEIHAGVSRAAEGSDADLPPPTGTLFVLIVYIVVLCAMWGGSYWLLVTR